MVDPASAIRVSSAHADVDRDVVYAFISESYWAKGMRRETFERALANSICFSAFDGGAQVGFARVATDRATFAYLADVFVLESHRGLGLALWLMQTIRAHPELQDLRRWALFTRDAHPLYRKVGFKDIENDPPRCMEIIDRGLYARMKARPR